MFLKQGQRKIQSKAISDLHVLTDKGDGLPLLVTEKSIF